MLDLRTSIGKKRSVGLLLFVVILVIFFSFNRFPKLDIVGEDLDAVAAPHAQCFQGFCIERDVGTSFASRWFVFSVTYLRLVTVGMTFAFVVAGLAEAFLFPSTGNMASSSGGVFKRTLKGASMGPVMNLCSACIVPVSSAFHKKAGLEGAIAMVQGSATMNIPALAMVFFVFTPLLGLSRLVLAVVGALIIGPIVVLTVRKERGASPNIPEQSLPDEDVGDSNWRSVLVEAFRDWSKISVGYFARMGPIMVIAGFASGLAMQWLSPEVVSEYLGNDLLGISVAATFGILINVPLLFEIPLVALLLLLGMGTAPAAALLFTAAAGGPVTFWGLAKLMPKRAIAAFAAATWSLGAVGGLSILGIGMLLWEDAGLRDTRSEFVETLSIAETAAAAGEFDNMPPLFADVSSSAGIDFVHNPPEHKTEQYGAGIVVFDFDGDGLDDVYVTDTRGPNALYHNGGKGIFVDVAVAAGIDEPLERSIGGCAADYDNDGDRDLYLTNYGVNRLFQNNGDMSFSDVTGTVVDRQTGSYWSMGCAWGDYDQDGFVDLIVVRYFNPEEPVMAITENAFSVVGGLDLYHNNGGTQLSIVTSLLGDVSLGKTARKPGEIGNVLGTGFQPRWFDFDNDGDLDLYVVNDLGDKVQANAMWRNDGPGDTSAWRFVDVSKESGTAIEMFGMGIAVGDYNVDGHMDFFVTNIGENVLFKNNGDGLTFENSAANAGVSKGELGVTERVTWGTVFFDYDNDADEDLYIASGYLKDANQVLRRQQPNLLLENNGDGTFRDLSPASGADDSGLGRGVVYVDYDQDGCLDLFLSNYGQRARLFRNQCDHEHSWLGVRLVGTTSNRDGIGARVELSTGNLAQAREVSAGSSQMSQNTLIAHFGMADSAKADTLTVKWPSGTVQVLNDIPANQIVTITEPK